MTLYALRIILEHLSFRLPSLLSIAETYDFPIKFVSEDLHRSILVVELEKEEDVQRLLDRGTVIQWAAELYASGSSYDELHTNLRKGRYSIEGEKGKSFKISPEASNYHIPNKRQLEIIESFGYVEIKGRLDLNTPDVDYVVFEDYDFQALHNHDQKLARDGMFRNVYLGRRIGYSRARPLVHAHSIKNRAYYGNTSMDAEMGFLLATQALPLPGKVIYDPFAGTGSLLYAAAEFGAYVLASDIDGRQMRGKGKGKDVVPGMIRSAEQYGLADKFLDLMTFDVTRSPMRRGGWLDAIITDPPYGVRAGAKRLGKKETRKKPPREDPYILPDGSMAHQQEGYLPPFRPYELTNLTLDLIYLARYLLVPKGRLVFFLPTVTEEYDEIDIPVVEGMKELKVGSGSVQEFGKWGRRLITMEKVAEDDGPRPTFEDHEVDTVKVKVPGHYNFRERYFERFAPRGETASVG